MPASCETLRGTALARAAQRARSLSVDQVDEPEPAHADAAEGQFSVSQGSSSGCRSEARAPSPSADPAALQAFFSLCWGPQAI